MTDVRTVTGRERFRSTAREAPEGTRVPVVCAVEADPFEAYRRARGDAPSFYLETSGGREGWGYFGVDPDRLLAVDSGVFERLERALAGESLVRGSCSVPYPGGLFGWLSYDAAREIEALPETTRDDRDLPCLQLGRYPRVVAWRTPQEGPTTLRVVASPRVEDPTDAYERGRRRAERLARNCLEGDPSSASPRVDGPVQFEATCSRSEYVDRVRQVKSYVRAGDTFQANVSHRLTAPAAVGPVEVFRAMRRVNPAPYSALVEFPGLDLVSASPELLLERDGRQIRTEPIAGTRPRGATDREDRALERELLDDEKERAEHAMLVDLERNDLGKVSEYGSVAVEEYRRVDRYAEVMHLVSEVSGRLRPECGLADAIRATFPGGTITGAPKPRTMEIIDEIERTRRGPYTGSVAAVGFDGAATLNILIRTLVRYDGEYHLRVGGGVVEDSVPDREYEETLAKAQGVVDSVDAALEGTTLEVRR